MSRFGHGDDLVGLGFNLLSVEMVGQNNFALSPSKVASNSSTNGTRHDLTLPGPANRSMELAGAVDDGFVAVWQKQG